ncbi:MAG: aminopeptidase, partial [Lachnospiraceae bacterium]|nr:aminopeptidase [Lachnospiraceae bacterium]
MERKNAWLTYDEAQLEELRSLNEGYKDFLSKGKTERECVEIAVRMAEEAGYRDLNSVKSLKAGDKVYAVA